MILLYIFFRLNKAICKRLLNFIIAYVFTFIGLYRRSYLFTYSYLLRSNCLYYIIPYIILQYIVLILYYNILAHAFTITKK
jgi:hypothetical protein